MIQTCYACNECAYEIFKGNEQAFSSLVKTMDKEQLSCFILNHDIKDLMVSYVTYFGDENLVFEKNQIIFQHPLFHKIYSIKIYENLIECDHVLDNPLVEFLYRVNPIWAVIDEKGSVSWLGYCQNPQKRVE